MLTWPLLSGQGALKEGPVPRLSLRHYRARQPEMGSGTSLTRLMASVFQAPSRPFWLSSCRVFAAKKQGGR